MLYSQSDDRRNFGVEIEANSDRAVMADRLKSVTPTKVPLPRG